MQGAGRSRHSLLRLFVALLLGGVMPFAFAPFGYALLALLGLIALILLLEGRTPGQAFALGYAFGFGMFLVGVNWVYISIHYFGHSPLPAAIGVMLLLVAFLALFPATVAYFGARNALLTAPWRWLVYWPLAWVLSEWVRSWLFTGFPWLNLGYSQIDSPLAGYAPIVGVYGVAWLLVLAAGLLVWALRTPGRARWLGSVMVLVIGLVGSGLSQIQWTKAAGAPLRVSMLQGNIPQDEKWEPKQQVATIERYLQMTRTEWYESPNRPDLVIWPETAIPAFYHQVEEDYLNPLRAEAQQANSDILTGIPVLDREGWEYYNAVISLGRSAKAYYKHHLVPFGEYLPLREWFGSLLQVMPLPVADFSSGSIYQLPLMAAGYPVGVSICYEVVFGEEIITKLPAAALLVNVSNDAWFGDSLAPHQHLEMARMRALETGRYLLRATNTGISAIIAPNGDIQTQGAQFERLVVRGQVEPRRGSTPYVLWGNWPVVSLALLMLVVLLLRVRRKMR